MKVRAKVWGDCARRQYVSSAGAWGLVLGCELMFDSNEWCGDLV